MERRDFLRLLLSVPLLGGLILFISPVFRYLKPTAGPFPHGLVGKPDSPSSIKDIKFALSEFAAPWTVQEFTYEQKNPIYTRQGAQVNKIPGYALRVPGDDGKGNPKFEVYSRICPHMGCIFQYVPNPEDSEKGYNYKPEHGQPVFACPCHLSVYDPLQDGKVVSGPAPRPPRHFDFKIESGQLIIGAIESGGIA